MPHAAALGPARKHAGSLEPVDELIIVHRRRECMEPLDRQTCPNKSSGRVVELLNSQTRVCQVLLQLALIDYETEQ